MTAHFLLEKRLRFDQQVPGCEFPEPCLPIHTFRLPTLWAVAGSVRPVSLSSPLRACALAPGRRRSAGAARNPRWTIQPSQGEWPCRARSRRGHSIPAKGCGGQRPETPAASVTLRPRGSRQFCLMPRPGWGGFFMAIVSSLSLVIVDQIDVMHVTIFKSEGDSPVARNRNAPQSFPVTPERMQSVPRQIKVARLVWRHQGLPRRE